MWCVRVVALVVYIAALPCIPTSVHICRKAGQTFLKTRTENQCEQGSGTLLFDDVFSNLHVWAPLF